MYMKTEYENPWLGVRREADMHWIEQPYPPGCRGPVTAP